MRLLLDQGLPRSSVPLLAALGHDVVHVGDVGLAAATDRAIVDEARAADRVIVTADADFHALVALSGHARPSVVRLRVEGLRAGPLADLLAEALADCAADLAAGALVTVEMERVRVRALPIAPSPRTQAAAGAAESNGCNGDSEPAAEESA